MIGLSLLFCACGGYAAAGTYVMDREATLAGIPEKLLGEVQGMTAELLLQPDGTYHQRSTFGGREVRTGGSYTQSGDSLSLRQQHFNGQPQSGSLTGTIAGDTLSMTLSTGEEQFVLVMRRASDR